jgi:hypothetical protein
MALLPDGSGFAVASLPMPKDHWLYNADGSAYSGEPPAPMRMGEGPERDVMAAKLREAGRYAVRAATMCGHYDDFDPDALVQNLVVGMLGYWTKDGFSHADDE